MINFKKFDILGIFRLNENKGVEKLTTPLSDGTYLSRSMFYYTQKTCAQCSKNRELIREMYDKNLSAEKKFVIYENMLNLSAKVFYKQLQLKIANKPNQYFQAKKCFEEDCYNLIAVMTDKKIKNFQTKLPEDDNLIDDRQIELDNKALIICYVSALNLKSSNNLFLTGLGGLYLAPFCKLIYGTDYVIAPLSSYAGNKQLLSDENLDITKYLSETDKFSKDNFMFIDDNIGTGDTANKIKHLLLNLGKNVKIGAVQFNWINYYKVTNGEKEINKFDISEIDYPSLFNYPGHKLLDHAVNLHLKNSADEYMEYIKSKGYSKENSDISELWNRGVEFLDKSDKDLKTLLTFDGKEGYDSKNFLERLHRIITEIENGDQQNIKTIKNLYENILN